MSETIERLVGKPRKLRRCYWCGEIIDGQHVLWTTFNRRDIVTTRLHEECAAAWQRGLDGEDSDYFAESLSYGEMSRGCLCSSGECRCEKTSGGDGEARV